MRILLSSSPQEAVSIVAQMILDRIGQNPSVVLGLATGRTMGPVYAFLVKALLENKVDLKRSSFFLLDEYIGLSENHPSTFKHYIDTHFCSPLGIDPAQIRIPPANEKDIEAGVLEFEETLKRLGGIDLQLLGIGRNGHIGFNEPGSVKNSRTRVITLSEETIADNRSQFVDDIIPAQALSMGIGTILDAKNIVLLATGKSKADAIKYLVNHHDDPSCPATYLKGHPHFTLVLDPEAASKINLKM